MAASWYFQFAGETQGPFTAGELQQKAATGELAYDAWVRETIHGDWVTANSVSGLFDRKVTLTSADPSELTPPLLEPPLAEWFAEAGTTEPASSFDGFAGSSTQRCPLCAEEIADEALKCKHCGEFLDRTLGIAARREPGEARCRWSPGIAAVLSVLVPGAGQMYRGKFGTGLIWLFSVCVGYALFIVPGLVLHLCCIFTAASGDPTKFG